MQTPAPDALSEADLLAIEAWAAAKYPALVPEVRSLAERCLDHFRGKGEERADWVATVRTWVGNEAGFKGHLRPRGGAATHSGAVRKSAIEQAAEMAERWGGGGDGAQ